jgi:MoaA/NifB/PqqE/SkfB family radical SAM enzyme
MLKKLRQLRYIKHIGQVYRYFFSPIKSIELSITYNCNFNCKGCYAGDLRQSVFMSKEKVKELIKKYKPMHVNLTGGEPLLHKNIIEIVREMPKSVVCSLVTNGSLLNYETLSKLKEAGLNTIQISFGVNYPKLRNLRMAEEAHRLGINVCLSVTNTLENKQYIIDAIEYAPTEGWHVLFNLPHGDLEKDFDIKTYLQFRNHPVVREDNMFWNGKDRCPAGTKKIYITADAKLMPCDRLHRVYNTYKDMRNDYKNNKTFCSRLGDIILVNGW